jgi:hypothetical protein
MVQAYNFLASWQLFPEKCDFQHGLSPKSGNYKIESIRNLKISIGTHLIPVSEQFSDELLRRIGSK